LVAGGASGKDPVVTLVAGLALGLGAEVVSVFSVGAALDVGLTFLLVRFCISFPV
jgi:hypothetical protein